MKQLTHFQCTPLNHGKYWVEGTGLGIFAFYGKFIIDTIVKGPYLTLDADQQKQLQTEIEEYRWAAWISLTGLRLHQYVRKEDALAAIEETILSHPL